MNGDYAEYIETEVLPRVEKYCGVKLTKDPDGGAAMGNSSGGSAALIMAWFRNDLYRCVLTTSGTFVNQAWPEGLTVVRGILVIGPYAGADSRELRREVRYREFMHLHGFAFRSDGTRPEPGRRSRDAQCDPGRDQNRAGALDSRQTSLYDSSMERTKPISKARQRILETADRLFYEEGFRAVGIDRIIAESEVAKATLYVHFPSKDDLILAVLEHRERSTTEFFRSSMKRHAKARGPLGPFFAALREWFESPGFRGCAFQNATVELADPAHAGTEFSREFKRRFGEFLRGLIEESVGGKAAKLAPAIFLLVEGAIVTAAIQGKPDAVDVVRDAAVRLIPEGGA
jgi:AcrR family transcriptional regulator